ncbi:hypothetical protein EB796_012055 [Bugula neritina]|uniref:Alpha-ketoglutarate-dependent dioxygenase AlkB-like domain-containing protein n=1 Tax=Bugula neritina TaxID=10212 RepID=A0A7J7JWA6_BUGNE|nr:hypothetical protein EB796_012055 [Bugula neritina]
MTAVFQKLSRFMCLRCLKWQSPAYLHCISRDFHRTFTADTTSNKCNISLPSYAHSTTPEHVHLLLQHDMTVSEDFVSEKEEKSLLQEIEPYMARLRYEYSHWDDAIHGYRETERSEWNATNTHILLRLKDFAFKDVNKPTEFVHVLDLEKDGLIKPHKDSVRFCGDTIAGISLLSDCIMRLVAIENTNITVDIHLKQRSLYIMRNAARFDFTHEILHNDHSYFKDKRVEKGRRVSIICRNNP